MEYLHHHPLEIAGHVATYAERRYWHRLHTRGRSWALFLITLLNLLFAYEAFLGLLSMENILDQLITAPLLIVATVFVVKYPFSEKKRDEMALKAVVQTEWTDAAAVDFGYLFTLRDDALVRTGLRGETVIPYAAVTLCTETLHGLYIQSGTTAVYIRSLDITSEQANTLKEWLYSRIPAENVRVKSQLVPCRTEPLPLYAACSADRVVARADVTAKAPRRAIRKRRTKRFFGECVLPAMVIYAVMMGEVWQPLGYYPLNLLFFTALTVFGGWVLTALLAAGDGKAQPVAVAFTEDGVAAFANGQPYFAVWNALKTQTNARGVWMKSLAGEQLFVPYAAIENPEAVKALIKGEYDHG